MATDLPQIIASWILPRELPVETKGFLESFKQRCEDGQQPDPGSFPIRMQR